MNNLFARFVRDESGATAIEYGLIAALIAVVIIGAVTAVGTESEHDVHAALSARRQVKRSSCANASCAAASKRSGRSHVDRCVDCNGGRTSRPDRASGAAGRRGRLGHGQLHDSQFPAGRADRCVRACSSLRQAWRRRRSARICWPAFSAWSSGFTLFALGYIGGGDAKLFACVAAVARVSAICSTMRWSRRFWAAC